MGCGSSSMPDPSHNSVSPPPSRPQSPRNAGRSHSARAREPSWSPPSHSRARADTSFSPPPPPRPPLRQPQPPEASLQVDNLRERGVLAYNRAKQARNESELHLALQLFRRAAEFRSANVPPALRASVHKNVLACHKLLLEWASADRSPLQVGQSFYAAIVEAALAYHAANDNAYARTLSWRDALKAQFVAYMSLMASVAAMPHVPHGTTPASRRLRANALRHSLASAQSAPACVCHEFHFRIASELLSASESALMAYDSTDAVALVTDADHHIISMEHAAASAVTSNEALLPPSAEIDNLRKRIPHHRGAAMSAQKIRQAHTALQYLIHNDPKSVPKAHLLPIIDLFKEAQVLARDTSPQHEAEACARLAALHHRFPAVRNASREARYYERAFAFLQSIDMQQMENVDWVNDTLVAYERIQRERMRPNHEKREPVLQDQEEMLKDIRFKLSLIGKEAEGLEFLYNRYPPKRGHLPVKHLQREDYKGAVKRALLHYHPDRNREDVHGLEHAVICEEITKSLNLLRRRVERGFDTDESSEDDSQASSSTNTTY